MERLQFELPEFMRVAWVSDPARDVWESRLERVRKAWAEIEWRAVTAGLHQCCVTEATPEDYLLRGGQWTKAGLQALPVELRGGNSSSSDEADSNSNETSPKRERRAGRGGPLIFRFVVGTLPNVLEFQSAQEMGDQDKIGRLLGYPPCCFEAYRRTWIEEGLVDMAWPQAMRGVAGAADTRLLEIVGPPQTNILWRSLGIQLVSHPPCRIDCQATIHLADQYVAVGRQAGFTDEMAWLLEILSWPVEWSALHGIAEIRTPVVKLATRTDATPRKYTIRRQGEAYPAEGASGVGFPYRSPHALPLSQSRGFLRGLENPIAALDLKPAEENEAPAGGHDLVQLTLEGLQRAGSR